MNMLLQWLQKLVFQHPKWVYFLLLLCSLVSLFLLWTSFSIQTNIAALLPQENQASQQFAQVLDYFGHQDSLLILLEGERPDLIEKADQLAAKLAKSSLIERIDYKISPQDQYFYQNILLENLFLYATPQQFDSFLERLQPQAIQQKIRQNLKKLYSADPTQVLRIQMDPLGFLEAFYNRQEQSPFDLTSGYWLAPNQKALLMKIRGTFPAPQVYQSIQLMEHVRTQIRSVSTEGVRISYLGGYFVAEQKYYEFRRDLIITVFSSLFFVLLILWFAFRRILLIFLVGFPLHIAILWTLAFGGWFLGPLTSIATAFIAILVGVGVDFAIHFMNRFSEESQQRSLSTDAALKNTLSHTGKGILVAGITTIFGFSSFYYTDFKGFAELGLLSALGIFCCVFLTLTCFPVLLQYYTKKNHLSQPSFSRFSLGSWSLLGLRFPKSISFVTLLFTLGSLWILCFYQEAGLPFRSNIYILRPQEQKEAQEKLAYYFKQTEPLYVVYTAKDEEELLKKSHHIQKSIRVLQKQNVLKQSQHLAQFIPEIQQQKDYQKRLHQLNAEAVVDTLKAQLEKHGFQTAAQPFETHAFSPQNESYGPYLEWLKRVLESSKRISLEELPSQILESFVQKREGKWWGLTYLYPEKPLKTKEDRKNFLVMLEKKLPPETTLTGLPVLLYHLEHLIFKSFLQAMSIAGCFIFIILCFQFRGKNLFLVLLPMSLGCLWMLASLKLVGIPLNFMNIVVFPMVLGLGIDDGVHFMLRYLEKKELKDTLYYTGGSILLTSATTMLGFGSLCFAQNLGLVSIGVLAALGIFYCLILSLFVLPALITLFEKKHLVEIQKAPD